jgi:uncharacterized protein
MIRLNASHGIPSRYANRHGLITGATGTGKTVSIMRLVESFADAGVPVFCPDVKGDLLALARSCNASILQPLQGAGTQAKIPLWQLGADLLSRALELTVAQAGTLEIVFAYADQESMPFDTLQHLRELLMLISAKPELVAPFGHVTRASLGTIQRALLRMSAQGAGAIFGATGFDVANLLDPGKVSILDSSALYESPRLYGAFLLFILRELSKRLPESGDLAKPRLVLIFDESHVIFDDLPPLLLRSIEASARLIRSKGIGRYFASQSSDDVPAIIRAQCATRIEHARGYGVGSCLFSTLDSTGKPATRVMIRPDLPRAQLGALSPDERAQLMPQPIAQRHVTQESVNLDRHGLAFLAVLGAALLALCFAIGAGYGGALLAGAIGLAIALR